MSTRSRIGLENPDDTIRSIYCHSDGYPEHNGVLLNRYYNTPDKVNALLDLGDLSSLGTHYDPAIAKLAWEKPYSEWTDEERDKIRLNTSPYDDSGEKHPARVDEDFYDFSAKLGRCGEEYTYLYRKGYDGVYEWEIAETPYFNSLAEVLEKKNEDEDDDGEDIAIRVEKGEAI